MKHCCKELAQNLGRHEIRPTPAYISSEEWDGRRRRAGWYPGATGPGYYLIHDLDETEQVTTPGGVFTQPKIEYRRLETCPYCGKQIDQAVSNLQANTDDADLLNDNALAENLAETCDILNEIGAAGIWILRGAIAPGLAFSLPGYEAPVYLDIADAGLLLVARFPAGDGGEPGIETR